MRACRLAEREMSALAIPRAPGEAGNISSASGFVRALCAGLLLFAAASAPAQTDSSPSVVPARSADSAGARSAIPADSAAAAQTDPFPPSNALKSDFFAPLLSVVIPGFGQYMQGEYGKGLAFTGTAVGGLLLAFHGVSETQDTAFLDDPDLSPKDGSLREILLGSQAYQGAAFLSAYDAFRAAVPAFQHSGQYRFLTSKERLGDLFIAPVRFSFLKRPTTFVPMGLLAIGMGTLIYIERRDHPGADWTFSADDVPFSLALSYNAGLTEEAAFRGYLLPLTYQYTGSFFLSNFLQAGLFGAAHYRSGADIPWPQALLGYYFGYLERRNQWSISEGVFNHFWWDAMVFTAGFLTMRRVEIHSAFTVPIPSW
jgi:membrane protease YdiL (CAAX protease family)